MSEAGEEQVGSYAIYFAEGDALAKQGEYVKAIESFTKALEFQSEDKPCLVARSKCFLKLGRASEALEDAETSLKDDNKYYRGLYQKAEALYQMGNFELALVFYHRGNKIRSDIHEFTLGIHKAQEAIENSIGTADACKLEKIGDLSYFKQQDALSKKKGMKARKAAQAPKGPSQGPVASEKTTKELLGELYADRQYLEKLLKDPSLASDRKEICSLVQEGLAYLDSRTEFWRQQKPMYARKREKELKKWNRSPTRPQAPFRSTRGVDYTKFVFKSLEEIDTALGVGNAEDSLSQAEKVLNTVQGLTERDLPNKEDFLASLHASLGSAHLELGNTELALEHFTQDLKIVEKHQLAHARARALCNVGKVYSMMGNYQKSLEFWLKRVPLPMTSEESAWLFHDIGRCYCELGKWQEAKEYGEKSLTAARDAKDEMWQLNASVMIGQSEAKLGDNTTAVQTFTRAMELAQLLGDTHMLTGIKKALTECNSRIVEDLQKQQTRQMEEDTKQALQEGGDSSQPSQEEGNVTKQTSEETGEEPKHTVQEEDSTQPAAVQS